MATKDLTAMEAVKEVIALNPWHAFRVISRRENPCILSKISPEELKLPEGWEFNTKNGITNKHNTQSGAYQTIDVIQQKR